MASARAIGQAESPGNALIEGSANNAAAAQPALSFEDVSFSYGRAALIDGLSLSVRSGRVTGIVGPNGCGKSTLLKLAVGLEKPDEGAVLALGRDVAKLSAKERARTIALLPQSLPAAPMTVRALVACGRYAYQRPFAGPGDADRAAVDEALAETGLSDIADKSVQELSGGQRQRAYLAMVMAQQPRVMLLDEPTSALDIRAAHDMLALVRRLAQRGETTVCMVVHDLDLALRYCDEIAIMERGAVLFAGSPGQVVSSGMLERTFDVDVRAFDCELGRAWTFYPKATAAAQPANGQSSSSPAD